MGIGSSWPHDFLFLTGFFSSGFVPSSLTSGGFKEVAVGAIVSWGISVLGGAAMAPSEEREASRLSIMNSGQDVH